ncbi:MAG: xanthine dehydrogenase family protein molybdopterin-binding subunit [Hymenobacter sp.]|nr:MAG: xanthine dehydrogenase family protein molybdopterin-binding subunit [Hymenobacter sp.]
MYPHASAALTGVPDGYYIVQYAFGSALDGSCVSFADTRAAWQFPGTESLRTIAAGDSPRQLQYSLMAEPSPADVVMDKGRLQLKADPSKGEAYGELMKRAGMSDIEGSALGRYGSGYEAPQATATANPNKKEEAAEHSMHAFGAHFCEVHVDPELGTVRITKWVSVIAGGRILNPKTARSQVMGGSIFGIGAALMEETMRDPNLARYTNADLAGYHVPVNADIPNMTVEFIDEHDPYVNAMGVKGIGEISIVGVTAAVANAVFHATGRRLRSLPMTPDKVLEAMRQPA